MSAQRDWDRDRRRQLAKAARKPKDPRPYAGPVLVDPLETVIREAVAAKRAGRFYRMPADLTESDQSRAWRVAFSRLRSDAATGGAR